jgi:hypothetical protein
MAIKKGDKVTFSADAKVLTSINREGKPAFITDAVAAKIAGKEGVVLDTTDINLYGERIAIEVSVEFEKAVGVSPIKLTDKLFRKISDLKKTPKTTSGKWGFMGVLLIARRDMRVVLSSGVKVIQSTDTQAAVAIDAAIVEAEKILAKAKASSAEIKAGTFKAPPTPAVKNPGSKGGKKPKADKPAIPAKK